MIKNLLLRLLFTISLFGLFSSALLAQSKTPSGTFLKVNILDSLTKEPLEIATISVTYDGADAPTKYGSTDENGAVTLTGMTVGKISLRLDYMGYRSRVVRVTINRGANELKDLLMQQDATVLDELVVTDVANPITVKKDTIEYNASSFKINDTDMVEELLKKLPGVEIDTDGNITANGKSINKIMIDGKEFFLDDPQLATKNLPAKIVEKVRVVEKKSDQALFTGIDDGNEETVIDLKMYKGMMDGWFGNLSAGYGTEDRYQAGGLVAKFTSESSVAILGNGNNTNNRGFTDIAGSMMGGMRGGMRGGVSGGNSAGKGITTSWMGGLNANTSLLDDKLDLSGNYMYTGTDKDISYKSAKQTMLDENTTLFNNEEGYDISLADGHRVGGVIDYKISDNTSLLFRPNVNIGYGSFDSYNTFSTLTNADSTNRGYSSSYGDNNSQSANGTLLFRQKLGKVGRTMSLKLNYNYSNNEIDGFNKSMTKYFLTADSALVDQKYYQKDLTSTLGARLSYTEPFGNNFYMEAAYSYDYKKSNSDKDTWNMGSTGEYSDLDSLYSSHYENIFVTQMAELNLMKQHDKYNLTVGASVQPSTTKSFGRGKDTTYSVLNFAPSARFEYRVSDTKFINAYYRGKTSQPSISQLLPVQDNTNPLIVTVGNDNLNPEFSHNINGEYRTNNKSNFSWFSVGLGGSYTTDKIVTKKEYSENGVQTTSYENTSTPIYSGNARVMYNSVIARSNFSVSTSSNIRYGNGVSYVLGSAREYEENVTKNLSISEQLKFTYRNDYIEAILGGKFSYNNAWYTVETMDDISTWNNSLTASVNATIPGGFNVTTDVEHFYYIGYDSGYNEPATVWNAQVSKSFLNNNATIKVNVYDILNNSKSVYRTTTENYIMDVQNNTLGQYFMFSFVYRFGKFVQNKRGRGGMSGGRGPGSGGRGPGMMGGGPGRM